MTSLPTIHQTDNVPIYVYTDDVDEKSLQQLKNVANLPIIEHHLAAMPDVHFGYGATVGSVIPTINAVIPSAVGVDIGCGMCAGKFKNLKAEDLPDSLRKTRRDIESVVPVGMKQHRDNQITNLKHWDNIQDIRSLIEKYPEMVTSKNMTPEKYMKKALLQLGTLGSGNHFIELCLDENDDVWIMLHSGSRGCGNIVGNYFTRLAKKDMEGHIKNLPDADLAYFKEGSKHYDDYVNAVSVMQTYAANNRELIFSLAVDAIKKTIPGAANGIEETAINCHHNYIEREVHFGKKYWITRKGAIKADKGDLGIIPGSMGAKSFIVEGKGDANSFNSCSHGAGRAFGRKVAKQKFSVADLVKQTEGVECRKDEGVLDEIPSAYKDIDVVMKNQTDLVNIKYTLKQVLNVKG